MTMKAQLFATLFGLIGIAFGYVCGVGVEQTKHAQVAPVASAALSSSPPEPNYDAEKNECVCGKVRTCPFGPGIVGQQECRTNVSMINIWSRCEPVPAESP